MSRTTSNFTVLNAVTTTTTSDVYDVSMRTKISLQFTAASITSGNGVFSVSVSNDGVNFVTYDRLTSNATNTNSQNDTRVASVTLSSNGSQFVFFPIGDYFRYIKVTCTVTTDGAYSASLQTVG